VLAVVAPVALSCHAFLACALFRCSRESRVTTRRPAQVHAGAAWANAPGAPAGGRVAPTLEPLALRAGAVPSAVLAGGAHGAAVLSEHGRRLEALEYPVRRVGIFTRALP